MGRGGARLVNASKFDAGPTERLLSRLDGVRETSTGQYMARCPAHDDKSPSLSVTERDGKLLVTVLQTAIPEKYWPRSI